MLLTLSGAISMIAGAFGPWAGFSSLPGSKWSYLAYGDAIGVDFLPLGADAQRFVPTLLISAGLVAILLGALAAFGLTGKKGRLTRVCAILCALFVTGSWSDCGSVRVRDRPGWGRSSSTRAACSPSSVGY